jgi:zinc protease
VNPRTLAIGAVLLLSAALRVGFAQAPAPVRLELPNGLRVWVQEDHTRPVALVQVAYKVGAINEGPGTTGTAHYVEHMVYRATQNIRNEDVYGYIDRIGGRYTGGTSRDGTTYGETVPIWALEDALRTTAERMGRALFDSTEFERERNNVVTEANGFSRTDPVTAFRDAVMLTSFELHPYRYSSNTWSQDNLAITRNDAFDFYKRYYGPNNAVLSVVGDVSVAEVRSLVTQHFGPLARAPFSGEVRVVEPPQRVEKRIVLHYAGERKQVDIVYRSPQASHRDYPVLVVLDRLLAGRLQRAVTGVGGAELTTVQTATPYPFVYRITASADATADLDRIVAAIQGEIERLAGEGVTATDMATAKVEVPQQGRGGRGRGGGTTAGGGVPPRQSNLTAIAGQLTGREVFPWEVGVDLRDRIRRAQENVTSADIQAYVDRWLRPSQRTVGFLVPGKDDFVPDWSNGRPLAGDRLEIPPLTTPPAKRMRPAPVPARSLEPLAKLPIRVGRRALANGAVVRAARNDGATAALQVRISLGSAPDASGKEGLSLLAARLIASDSGLQSRSARLSTTTLANEGYFDIRMNVPAANTASAVAAVARALHVSSFSSERVEAERKRPAETGGGRGGGGRGNAVNADARNRVLRAVAPAWALAEPGPESLARLTAGDVNGFVAKRLAGGAVTVSLVGPGDPTEALDVAAQAFAVLPAGRRVSGSQPPRRAADKSAAARPAPAEERVPVGSETQVTLLAGLPGVSRDNPDRRALELLNYIVGVPSYGGRLGWALTKAGLTYSSATATTFGATTGHITVSTKCDTRNLDATIQAIREVIAGVGENGVEEWEVREAQAFTLGRTLLYGPREDSGEDAIATALLDSETAGEELLDLPAWSRAWLAVTPEQVNAAARRYYRPELLKVVAIGAVPAGPPTSIFPAGTFRSLFER